MRSPVTAWRVASMTCLLLLGACSVMPTQDDGADIAGVVLVDAPAARQLLEAQVAVIDVRSREEWDAGHVAAAQLAPLDQFPQVLEDLSLDPSAPLLIYCRSGNRALQAGVRLVESGYAAIHVLRPGGFAQLQAVGVPVVVPHS